MKYQQIEMPIGGVDQYTDSPRVLPSGKLVTAQNVRFRNPPALQHRTTLTPLGQNLLTSGTLPQPCAIAGHAQDTLVASANRLYSYSKKADKWDLRGYLSECHVSRNVGYFDASATAFQDADIATNQGITVVAWSGSAANDTCALIIDAATDTIIGSHAITGAMLQPRVIAVGNYIYILSRVSTANDGIWWIRIDVTSGNYTFGALGSVTLTGTAGWASSEPTFDACPLSSTRYAVVYWDNAAQQVYCDIIDTATNATVGSAVPFTMTSCSAVAVGGFSGTTAFAIAACGAGTDAGVNVQTAAFNGSIITGSLGGPTVLDSTTGCLRIGVSAHVTTASAEKFIAVWERPASGTTRRPFMRWRSFSRAAAADTDREIHDIVPVSKPFTYSSHTYVVGLFGVLNYSSGGVTIDTRAGTWDPQQTFYLIEIADGALSTVARWVATASSGTAKPTIYKGYLSGWSASGTYYETATTHLRNFRYAKADDGNVLTARAGVARTRFDFSTTELHASAKWGVGRFYAGGRPGWYDGNAVTEHGFAWGPDYRSYAFNETGSSSILTDATYQVCAAYFHEDSAGNIVWSTPSSYNTMSVTTALQSLNILSDHGLELTARGISTWSNVAKPRVTYFRTLADVAEPFYRATSVDNGRSVSFSVSETIGDAATEDDANTAMREVLYTTGEILDNTVTPPCKYVVYHGDRLWLGGLEDSNEVWFSQPFAEGEQPRFNEALKVRCEHPVTALGSLDDKLVIFGRHQITVVHGDGPPATGGIETGFLLQKLPATVGCTSSRSVVLTPKGLMFLSERGFYLLGRDLSMTWIGAPVSDSTATYTTCVGAVLLQAHPEVVFALDDGSSASIRAIYNYELDAWTTDSCASRAVGSALTYDGTNNRYVYTELTRDSARYVMRDSVAYGPEASAHVQGIIVTGWIALNTIQGWQRIRKLLVLLDRAVSTTGMGLTVDVGFDYDESTWTESHAFSAAELAAITSKQVEVHLAKQACQAVRFRIKSTGDSDTTGYMALRSLVFDAGIRPARTGELDAVTQRK